MQSSDQTFYKYLTVSNEDKDFGLYVIDTGHASIPPGPKYPIHQHPSSHHFSWEQGRKLHEYHLLYIALGEGIFENHYGSSALQPGSLILLHPHEWHRYRPDQRTGWTEYWVGFSGFHANHLIQYGSFSRKYPVLQMGHDETLLQLFQQIIAHAKEENIGYQQIISGAAIHLLGHIIAKMKGKPFEGRDIETRIQKARIIMMENIEGPVNPRALADELHVGYSWFRKKFKDYTGLSPGQYHLQLKIQQARHLLINTSLPVKAIAYELGFESNHYFTRIFQQKTGFSPGRFRKQSK